MNVSDDPHTIDVTVTAENEPLFEKQYELEAGKGNTAETVSGEPTDVHVDISGGTSRQFEFRPPIDCKRTNDDPKIILTIWDATDVELSDGCAW